MIESRRANRSAHPLSHVFVFDHATNCTTLSVEMFISVACCLITAPSGRKSGSLGALNWTASVSLRLQAHSRARHCADAVQLLELDEMTENKMTSYFEC